MKRVLFITNLVFVMISCVTYKPKDIRKIIENDDICYVNNINSLCCDLLERYAEKPDKLEFQKCEVCDSSQVVVRAEYVTSGQDSFEVEKFLRKKYGMGKLRWICCGWESPGNYGSFRHKEITKINPNFIVSITMYGNGEVFDEDGDFVELEMDRSKVKQFVVLVEIVDC